MTKAEREKKIWDLLMDKIKNEYGVAAVMGNLMAESSMNPLCMTGKDVKKWKPQDYVNQINNGTMTDDEFAYDKIAFGLVQWYFWKRKEGLYNYAAGMDIGSVEAQIGYLLKELSESYKGVWNTILYATSVREASDIFMMNYERPATVTEAMKQRRANYGIGYFEKYATAENFVNPEDEAEMNEVGKIETQMVQTTVPKVVVRSGNGKEYSVIGRIQEEGTLYPWVADAVNGWHAIIFNKQVRWVSPEFTKVVAQDTYIYA